MKQRALDLASVRQRTLQEQRPGVREAVEQGPAFFTIRVPCSLVLRGGPWLLASKARLHAMARACVVLSSLEMPADCAIVLGDGIAQPDIRRLQIMDISLTSEGSNGEGGET